MNRVTRQAGAAGLGLILCATAIYVAVQGVAGLGGWLGPRAAAEQVDQAIAAVIGELPYLEGLASRRPALHADLISAVARAVEVGRAPDQISGDARALFERWRAEALPRAPDRILVAYLDLATERLRVLKIADPALCSAITRGGAGDSALPDLGPQLDQREMYVNRLLLHAGDNEPASRMTSAEVRSITREIHAGLQAIHGADVALLDVDRQTTPGEDSIICALGIETMAAIAGLGPDRAPAAVRALFFGG